MNVPSRQMLSNSDLSDLKIFGHRLDDSTPLWYYALKEGEIVEGGLRLGPVGGRIVGEVIIGLLQLDQRSYLADDPRWRPTLPTRSGRVTGDFTMVDFLTFAAWIPSAANSRSWRVVWLPPARVPNLGAAHAAPSHLSM